MTFWRPVDSDNMAEVVKQSASTCDRCADHDVVCVNSHTDEVPD